MNAWEGWFDVVMQVRDYDGRSGIDKGDTRLSIDQAADKLLRNSTFALRKQYLLSLLAAWRRAAQEGLLPHPGEIPEGAESLAEVPGWEQAEWPDSDLFKEYHKTAGSPPLPSKSQTKQCDRSKAFGILPMTYTPREDPEPKKLLITFAALGQRLLEVESWTEADREAWRTHVEPMLDSLIGIIPCEASACESGRSTEVDGDDHEGARAS